MELHFATNLRQRPSLPHSPSRGLSADSTAAQGEGQQTVRCQPSGTLSPCRWRAPPRTRTPHATSGRKPLRNVQHWHTLFCARLAFPLPRTSAQPPQHDEDDVAGIRRAGRAAEIPLPATRHRDDGRWACRDACFLSLCACARTHKTHTHMLARAHSAQLECRTDGFGSHVGWFVTLLL